MRSPTWLQDAINDRYDCLADNDAETIDRQVALTRDWIKAQPELWAILEEAKQVEPGLDFETWRMGMTDKVKAFAWPSHTEAGQAWLIWQLMDHVAAGCDSAATTRQVLNHSARFQALNRETAAMSQWVRNDYVVKPFVKQVFRPFFHYLSHQVSRESTVVHVLQRYVTRVQLFDYGELDRRFKVAKRLRRNTEATAAKHPGEDVYDNDLQRFLFLDAGYITFAKARVAAGEPDLVGGIETDDPLICEGKLYVEGTTPSYLAGGFHQVVRAAHKYNKTVAYLVVFNRTEKRLQFEVDSPAGAWAPYVNYGNVRVHIIEVRVCPPETTDSKAGKAKEVMIKRADLVNVDDQKVGDAAGHEEIPAVSGI